MHDVAHTGVLDAGDQPRYLGALGPRIVQVAGGIGGAALGLAIALALLWRDQTDRFFEAYLVNYCYYLSLALGGLFFVTLQHLTRSGWSVVIRRLAEVVAANLLLMLALFVPVLVGLGHLYQWTSPELVAKDDLLAWKTPYLNKPFFFARCAVYFVVWIGLSRYFLWRSVEQDHSGDATLTLRMERVSAPGMVAFAITVTFAAFDWIMSIQPHWFSTIFGVYYFAGAVIGIFATLILAAVLLERAGRLGGAVTIEHYHDLGKLLFAFVFFWAYIAFSQYMLIWYANLPEETTFFFPRQKGPWAGVAVVLIVGHFCVPFLGLISRSVKRCRTSLVFWSVWMLVMHWIDLYWLILPAFHRERIPFNLFEVLCFVGIGGLFVAAAARTASHASLVPQRDPRLAESLRFQNV